jgi:hypothetical protein
MWPFSRKKTQGQGEPGTSRPLSCSFCGKSQDDVRKLIAGPGVYICDECISLCNDILAEEFAEEFGKAASKAATPQPTARWVTTSPFPHCILCRIPQDPEKVILIPDRGPLCTVVWRPSERLLRAHEGLHAGTGRGSAAAGPRELEPRSVLSGRGPAL